MKRKHISASKLPAEGWSKVDVAGLWANKLFPLLDNSTALQRERRWCTDPDLSGIRSLKGHDYFVASLRRTDFGRAHASIRLRTAQPMAASVC